MTVVAEEGADGGTIGLPPPPLWRRWRWGAGRPVGALVAAVVVIAVVLTVAFSVTERSHARPRLVHDGVAAKPPTSRAVVPKGAHNSPRTFRLVSYIEGPQWQKGSAQCLPACSTARL